jgi:hypothetical protein
MQTDRFTILLGPAQKSFRVPQGLLIQRSSVFEKMESTEQVIRLPKDPTTFEHFFIWLHTLEPCLSINSIDAIVDLTIFAEKYYVYHLKNQTSDVIRTALIEERWKITPETITKVYKNVPAGTILRQLCFLGFMISYNVTDWMAWYRQNDRYAKWETAFCNCPDLGWDYFKHSQTKGEDTSTISSGGACRFHDHSDIAGWVCRNRTECPYPQGAPVDMPPEEDSVEEHEKEPTEEDAMPEDAPVVVLEDPLSEDATLEDAMLEDAVLVDTAVEDAAVEDAVPMVVPEDPPSEDTALEDAPVVVPEDPPSKDAVAEDALADYTVLEDADTVMDDDSWKRPLSRSVNLCKSSSRLCPQPKTLALRSALSFSFCANSLGIIGFQYPSVKPYVVFSSPVTRLLCFE